MRTSVPAAAGTSPRALSLPGTTGVVSAAISPAQQTFDVTWKPQTKIIPPSTIASAYRGVASDGALQFDASASDVAALGPGSVTVFSGLALRKVTAVTNSGGMLHVATSPATLDDAIAKGHIARTVPLDFAKIAAITPPGFERWIAEPALADDASFHYHGTLKKWDVDLTLTPSAGNLHMIFVATKTIGGSMLEVKGDGELDGLTDSADMTFAGGNTSRVTFTDTGLHGKVHLTWNVAFDKTHGGDDLPELAESDVGKVPIPFYIPFVVGPIPFEFQIKAGYAFSPAFSSKTTVAQGAYDMSYGGSTKLDQTAGAAPDASAAIDATGSIDSYGGTVSVAPFGLSATLMLPKFAVSLGAPPELDSILGESNAGPYVALMTTVNFVATGPLSIVPCERRELVITAISGIDANLLGHDITVTKPITIYTKKRELVVPNNIKICQDKSS